MKNPLLFAAFCACSAMPLRAQSGFVNWESPHVHPLELSPDGSRLFAVNTADGRLEVFDATAPLPILLASIPVGVDPVSVRARSNGEVWVTNHISDSISVVDVAGGRVVATLDTLDEPCDVAFAGAPLRAFVTCSQANAVLVFDPSNLASAPQTIALQGEDPRALCVSPDGSRVFAAIFESGNRSTVLGGGILTNISFPPNVVSDPAGPYGGQNPPPNSGASFVPPQKPNNAVAPKVALIVKKDAAGAWMDDNQHDWTAFVSGAQAAKSGRPVGWDLFDHDVAVIDSATLGVTYMTSMMNACMALAVNPGSGEVTVVGTDATNEVRYEPNLNGRFLRVEFARAVPGNAPIVADLNPHLDYATSSIPQAARNLSLGDPRGIVWNAAGTRGYVSGMGSNNLVVVDAQGARAGSAPTIEVGEGPTGLALSEARGRLFVLDKFEAAISVVDTASEREIGRVGMHDATPQAAKVGRRHLYGTHENSGLGQIACASCHIDARLDRLAWDLGDPSGAMKGVAGSNLGGNVPGLNTGFTSWHPMKGPMTTQTLQDIIGKEPLHWRGDRAGLEEFNPAFVNLQGADAVLSAAHMQEFENFLATISYPPNPYRNRDNSLPTKLPLPGHHTTGRFGPAGLPLPDGDATRGLSLYRAPKLLDNGTLACAACHTMPTGMGTDTRFQGGQFVPIAPGPNGEHHHALISQDGLTNISIKTAQLRNLYEKTGFDATQVLNTAGFGYLHDGSVDSIERFVDSPVFQVASDQDTADLVAFLLSFSGSELPSGSSTNIQEPPGTPSKDSHALVGAQTTLVDLASAPPAQLALLAQMVASASAGKVGLVAKGPQAGLARGWVFEPLAAQFQSDRVLEQSSVAQLQALAQPGAEITFTVVPAGTQTRVGIDRDEDGFLDRDELDAGSDPADADSTPGGCAKFPPTPPRGLTAQAVGAGQINLTWQDLSNDEDGFAIERSPAGLGQWTAVASLPADVTAFPDTGVQCDGHYDYRIRADNCAGSIGWAFASADAPGCCPPPSSYCPAAANSTGAVCTLAYAGSTSVAADDGVLLASNGVSGAGCLFFYGPAQVQRPFGGGTLCVGPGPLGVFRLGAAQTFDASGAVQRNLSLAQPPSSAGQVLPGSTWYFQLWYLDPLAANSTVQLSDALAVTFCP